MKPIVFALLVCAILSRVAAANERQDSILTVTTHGHDNESIAGPRDLALKFWVQQLAVSALYRMNGAKHASAADWERASKAPIKINCVYPVHSHVALPDRELLSFDEILVPIPERGYPDFLYLRNGESYSRISGYDPWVFWKLKVQLGIADAVPFDRALF